MATVLLEKPKEQEIENDSLQLHRYYRSDAILFDGGVIDQMTAFCGHIHKREDAELKELDGKIPKGIGFCQPCLWKKR